MAQSGGFCEVQQFEDVITNNMQLQIDADEAVADILANLQRLQADDEETDEAFAERIRANFDAADTMYRSNDCPNIVACY